MGRFGVTVRPRVWITRTAAAAQASAAKVEALGFEALVVPVLETQASTEGPDLTDVAQIAFTSANGVAAFCQQSSARNLPVACVGEATALAASEAGFSSIQIGPGGGHGLLQSLLSQPDPGLTLVVAPAEPAFDLAGGLTAAGRRARVHQAYHAVEAAAAFPPVFDVALIYSAKAARVLAARLPQTAKTARFVCLSEAIAEVLRTAGFPHVETARTPDEHALLQGLSGDV